MTAHMTVSRDKWLEARLDLLAAEKDLTRRSDEVAQLLALDHAQDILDVSLKIV